jgi:protein-S-isoprenylcysteine O-methyltransferase Ste14
MSPTLRSLIALLFGVILFVGLPLVGWGLEDISGFLSEPARLGHIILVLVLQIVIVYKFPDIGTGRGPGVKTVARQQLTIVLLQIIPLVIVLAAPFCDRRAIAVLGEFEPVRYLGLVLFAVGFLLVSWAQAVLGKQFSVQVTIQPGHELVTVGPFRYLRHPRYLGIILFTLGLALVFRSWLALLLVGAITLVLLWRIQDEEALLHQEFGTGWDAYASRTWRLVPFVY